MKTDGPQALLFDVDVEAVPAVKRPRRKVTRQPPRLQLGMLRKPYPHERPAHLGLCSALGYRAPDGKCPVWHCSDNVVLQVRRSGTTDTIVVGARGGLGKGASLPTNRTIDGKITDEDVEAMAQAAADYHNSLPSTCMWDYVEDDDLMPRRGRDREDELAKRRHAVHMTLAQIGTVLGMTREGVRRIETRAIRRLREDVPPDVLREWLEMVLEWRKTQRQDRTEPPALGFVPRDRLVRR